MMESDITEPTKEAEKFWRDHVIKHHTSWMQKSCVYHRCLWDHVKVPDSGKVVQLGVGVGMALELLYQKFGERTMGIDLFNMCDHPVLRQQDIRDLDDFPVAYVYCNVGNFNETPDIRRKSLDWSLRNLVQEGICLTAGNHPLVDAHLGLDMKDLARSHGCTVTDLPTDPLIDSMRKIGKYDPNHDCLIIKDGQGL